MIRLIFCLLIFFQAYCFENKACAQAKLLAQAHWISAEPLAPAGAIVFTKAFMTRPAIRSAKLYMTAHGIYEASLNGKRIGEAYFAPGYTSYDKRLQYQIYELTQSIRSKNQLQVTVAGGWYSGDSLSITDASRQGVTIQFGGGPHPQDWYGVLEAVASGRLDPLPSIGSVIGLDEVPEALDLARRSEGPPRIVVHPNGNPV